MENKTTILDNIMYNEDGSFRPFVGHHGNISAYVADYRNTYMEAEKDYFSLLLSDENTRNYLANLLYTRSSGELFEEALALQEKLENGTLESEEVRMHMQTLTPEGRDDIHLQYLEYAEGMMCLLFAAVRDKALVLNEIQCWEDRFQSIVESMPPVK